jgi:hypothetical protein
VDWPAAGSEPTSGTGGGAGATPRWTTHLPIACGYAGLLLVALFARAPWAGALAGIALAGLIFLPGLRRAEAASSAAFLLAAGVFLLLGHAGTPQGWLDGLPLLIHLALLLLFGRTLRRDREPLIACAIRVVEGPARLAAPGVAGYARGLTLFWTLLSAAQALAALLALACRPGGWLEAIGLAVPEPLRAQAWGTLLHVGNLAVVAVALAGEYAFRRCWLRRLPHLPLPTFILRLARAWPALVQAARAETPR